MSGQQESCCGAPSGKTTTQPSTQKAAHTRAAAGAARSEQEPEADTSGRSSPIRTVRRLFHRAAT
jgi:hypothetical protein